METTLTIIAIIVLAAYSRFVYESQREKNRQKAITRSKDNVMTTLASTNWKEDFDNDAAMRECEATCNLFMASRELLKGRLTDTERVIALEHAVKNFEQSVLIN